MTQSYDQAYAASLANPDAFWLKAADAIDWDAKPGQRWVDGQGWFADGCLSGSILRNRCTALSSPE